MSRGPWNELGFKTKGAWESELKRIKATPHGKIITGPDASLLMETLKLHRDAVEKIGSGIRHFITGKGPDAWGSTCFYLVRWDGTIEDFSYRVCLNGMPAPLAVLMSALRHAVQPDILRWKDAQFDAMGLAVCALSGEVVTSKNSHADHIYPDTFVAIARKFCHQKGVDPNRVEYRDDGLWALKDENLEREWIEFHNMRAKLRILKASVNCQLGSRAPGTAA